MGLEYLTDYIYHILKPDIGKYSIHVSIWESLTIKTSPKRKLNRQILNQQILGPVILETYPNVYIQIYSDTCTTLSISIYMYRCLYSISISFYYVNHQVASKSSVTKGLTKKGRSGS